HDYARIGELRERRHAVTGLELAAEVAQVRHERVGDDLRATSRDGPPVDVSGDTEDEREARGERMRERDARVRGEAREQCVASSGTEALAHQSRGERSREREARHRQRMTWWDRGREQAVREVTPVRDARFDECSPRLAVSAERCGGVIERTGE